MWASDFLVTLLLYLDHAIVLVTITIKQKEELSCLQSSDIQSHV